MEEFSSALKKLLNLAHCELVFSLKFDLLRDFIVSLKRLLPLGRLRITSLFFSSTLVLTNANLAHKPRVRHDKICPTQDH